MKNKLTLKAVRAELSPLNVVITKKDGEYKVRLKGSKPGEGYFTNDLQDALLTGKQLRIWNNTIKV